MDLFLNGATWIRADFHLHTKADSKFKYSDDENFYNSNYVDALIKANIGAGVIVNHNKFDFGEFKALRKTAKNQDVFLLPGVELSVNDGANGVHTLIVFSDEWLENENDRISTFITSMFPGKSTQEYQTENGRSDKNILQTVEELEKTGRDFFLVFAHVEDSKGLWHETGGGKLQDWRDKRYQTVKERTLAFQQVRTQDDRGKVKQWLGNWYPAEVEGSDPKSIEQIGQKKPCYLKIGAFTFEAVKFALIDHNNRLRSDNVPYYTHSHIKQIRFEGGTLHGQTIRFSPELNTLIGIRGSGKSSILESLRYVLGNSLEADDNDYDYKQKLIERTFGSGGKVVIDATDRHGQSYQIRRILKENANVFVDDKLQPGISIRETVLCKPLYFGQKEIAASDKGSEKELIEKLIGTKCDEIRRQISEQKTKVIDVIDRLSKVNNVDELIEEQTNVKRDAEHRLNFYKKHKLEEKLQKRLGFETDIRKANEGVTLIETFTDDVRDLLAKHEDELRNFTGYSSIDNADFFKKFDTNFSGVIQSLDLIKAEMVKSENVLEILKKEQEKLITLKNDMADEFASVERILADELKTSKEQNISTDEFLASKKKLASAEAALAVLIKNSNQKTAFQSELSIELQKLNDFWNQEFQIIRAELDEVSRKNDALKFLVDYKEDKKAFSDFFKSVFKGSGARDATFQNIVENYRDFIDIYSDFENAKKMFGSTPDKFANLFIQNLKTLLVYQTPNKFTITYHDMKLADHSLGQRASALILFILGQKENDVIIIDQPEDDLDNQTIYEDVIKLIREMKPSVQFIFATHNPNIPVLGDAEQIHSCSFADENINVQSGGLDDIEQQKRIVKIMEGGKEAFERRKEIYQIWKP
jgi:ABC-type cobalamin/Fe3+-siderophores transport system ATPase subunit